MNFEAGDLVTVMGERGIWVVTMTIAPRNMFIVEPVDDVAMRPMSLTRPGLQLHLFVLDRVRRDVEAGRMMRQQRRQP